MADRRDRSVRRRLLAPAAAVLVVASMAAACGGGVRVGPPRPVCKEIVKLEGPVYVEVEDTGTSDLRYYRLRWGRTRPVVLESHHVYRVGLRLGVSPRAPGLAARYHLDERAARTFEARAGELEGLPVGEEPSINALDDLYVLTRDAGRGHLFFQLSECYRGGHRRLRPPLEAQVPVVVVPPKGS